MGPEFALGVREAERKRTEELVHVWVKAVQCFVDVLHTSGLCVHCFWSGSYAALLLVAHAAERRSLPFNLGLTIGDFPSKIRGLGCRFYEDLCCLAVVALKLRLVSAFD